MISKVRNAPVQSENFAAAIYPTPASEAMEKDDEDDPEEWGKALKLSFSGSPESNSGEVDEESEGVAAPVIFPSERWKALPTVC